MGIRILIYCSHVMGIRIVDLLLPRTDSHDRLLQNLPPFGSPLITVTAALNCSSVSMLTFRLNVFPSHQHRLKYKLIQTGNYKMSIPHMAHIKI